MCVNLVCHWSKYFLKFNLKVQYQLIHQVNFVRAYVAKREIKAREEVWLSKALYISTSLKLKIHESPHGVLGLF